MSSPDPSNSAEKARTLQGWKEIAAHLGVTDRTAQAWEKGRGLPVRRIPGKRSLVYCLVSELEDWRATADQSNSSDGPKSKTTRQLLILSMAVVPLVVLALVWRSGFTLPEARPLDPTPLTSSREFEGRADVSPQADRVAYLVSASSGDTILPVLALEDRSVRDLVSDALNQSAVRWSPSGETLGYIRARETGIEIVEVDFSGRKRVVVSLEGAGRAANMIDNTVFDWGAAGLAVSGRDGKGTFFIELISPETGGAVRVTTPPPNYPGDTLPAFSPDGTAIAFARFSSFSECELFVINIQTGEERRLTTNNSRIWGFDWESDGSIIYASSHSLGQPQLRRMDLAGNSSAPLTGPEFIAHFPSIGGHRSGRAVMVYQKKDRWNNIWHARPGSEPHVAVESTWIDAWPDLAPDGERLAFISELTGAPEVWVARVNGSEAPRRLTQRNGPYSDMPRWSPDGTKITFSSADADGQRDIYLIDVANRETTACTTAASEEGRASWSRDGQWIYFRSDRSGRPEIWKRRADGSGTTPQVTFQGGYEAFESIDGQTLYYVRNREERELWSVPVNGGEESFVVDGPQEARWRVSARGVVFQQGAQFRLWDPVQDSVSTVYEIESGQEPSYGFTFSPALDAFWWVQTDRDSSELWMADL